MDSSALRILFFVEGFTDIRFVVGLSQLGEVTVAVPSKQYNESGLKGRVAESGAKLKVVEIPGGRLRFQLNSLIYLIRHAREFDVILAQEVLRGALNANLVGWLRGVPVVDYTAVAPLEYYRCRSERGQISRAKAWLGETVIRILLTLNGWLATRWLTMGPYLHEHLARYCARRDLVLYYGVDTDFFRPANDTERRALRAKHELPQEKFLIFLSSRISHEKDPETVLQAVSIARAKGLDAVVLNLGGGWRDFLELARELKLADAEQWVLGRPAVHPMKEVADFFRCSDTVIQASLAEAVGISTLESLAAGTPVIATEVGGLPMVLKGYARLTPRRDPEAMAEQILWVAQHPEEARAEAARGREYVIRDWNRDKAFEDLQKILESVARPRRS